MLDISKKIDPQKAAVLTAVDRAARRLGIPFFVIGAAARDFILQNGFGITTLRATMDVDIAVSVSSWDQFQQLIDQLLIEEHFTRTEVEHRFASPVPEKTLLDILPFGAIETVDRTIRWTKTDREMNMTGFLEAFGAAVDIRISSDPQTIIKVVSLAGLALLKILSWNDNPHERDRDAKDFRVIMYNYLEIQSSDYVFDTYPDIAGLGDYEKIAARSLGRDMAKISLPAVLPALRDILIRTSNEHGDLLFVQHMQQFFGTHDPTTARDLELVDAVRQGAFDVNP